MSAKPGLSPHGLSQLFAVPTAKLLKRAPFGMLPCFTENTILGIGCFFIEWNLPWNEFYIREEPSAFRMKNNRSSIVAIAALFTLLFIFPASVCLAGNVEVEFPDEVGVGKPFIVHATSQTPFKGMAICWNGKTIETSAREHEGQFTATAILGVGLNSEIGTFPIKISVEQDKKDQHINRTIAVVKTDFQHETLSVKPKLLKPPETVRKRIASERKLILAAINVVSNQRYWAFPFSRPVKGKMLSRFGLYRVFNGKTKGRHTGLDFRAWKGTPIHSIAAGKVILVGHFYFAGNCAFIDHGNGLISFYCHMSQVLVQEGDIVNSGQKIGLSGATGRATGAHLHLSIYAAGKSVDPEPFFNDSESGLHLN